MRKVLYGLLIFIASLCLITAITWAANIYPFTGGLTGGGTGALDKLTGTEGDDGGIVMLEDDATYGNAFMPFVLDVDGGGTEAAPWLIDSGDAGNEDWELCDIYGMKFWMFGATAAIALNDINAAGAALDDKYSGGIESNMTTTTEDGEISDTILYCMIGGTKTAAVMADGSGSDIIIPTGWSFKLGTTNWSNDSDKIDGEQIADDTIDNDSIDWSDMTDLTTDGAVVWGNIAEGELADSTVVSADIKDDTIDSDDYAAGSIDAEHLAADIIDETKLADDSIDSEHYNDGSIDAAHLAADIIDETKIADDGIDSEHYNDDSIDDAHINWGSGANQVDLADIPGGTAGANAFDFGGASSVELPNGTADVALAACGQIHINETDEQIGIHSGSNGEVSGEVAIPILQHIAVTFDPAWCYDQDSTLRNVMLFSLGDDFPEGITIDEWKLTCNTALTTGIDANLCRASDWAETSEAVMDALDIAAEGTSSTEDTDANINSGAVVANGQCIYISFDADPTDANIMVIFEMWFHGEED